jgi:hypothetical protein
LLLFVIGWPGPRPCIHNHEHFGQGAQAEKTLEQHLAEYHADALEHSVDPNLLHFHWVMFPDQAGEPSQNCSINCCSMTEMRSDACSSWGLGAVNSFLCVVSLEMLVERPFCLKTSPSTRSVQNASLQHIYCSMNC